MVMVMVMVMARVAMDKGGSHEGVRGDMLTDVHTHQITHSLTSGRISIPDRAKSNCLPP